MRKLVTGCDEVGRGCLAGPLVAAAVILPPNYSSYLLKDSKQLTPKQRTLLASFIREEALDWAIGVVEVCEVDKINVLNASHLAMHRAIDQLKLKPDLLLIDGNRFKPYPGIKHQCIVRGDEQNSSIAAASVIAKVYRDQYMQELALQIPGYHWEHNMGYPTLDHRKAIKEMGVTNHHRKTFRQVAEQLRPKLWTS
jgi:ribonuclease HII